MPDITMCKPKFECPYQENCYRYNAKPSRFQTYSDFSVTIKGRECEYYWKMEDKK